MTAEHKAALAAGRDQGRAVRRYLEALERQPAASGAASAPPSRSARGYDVVEPEADGRRSAAAAAPPPGADDLEAELAPG